jgi:uncharacterized membrane-anchored protein YitT (DUF2179 family)
MKSIAFYAFFFPITNDPFIKVVYRIGTSTGAADLAIRALISSTSFDISTKTPSFSG